MFCVNFSASHVLKLNYCYIIFIFLFTFVFISKKSYIHNLYVYVALGPTLPLCVLQNLFIKPALCELLTLVHQLEQLKILLWVYITSQYVLLHAHL